MAPLPGGFDGHFGPDARRFVAAQYHQGRITARWVVLLKIIRIRDLDAASAAFEINFKCDTDDEEQPIEQSVKS